MSNYIKKLSAFGLKSGNFNHDLDRVNLITGRSFTGKSSRIDSVILALKQYLNSLGKTGTMQLARNGELSVLATDNLGRTNEIEWTQKYKTGRLIRNEIPETPDVLTDPSVYFALSDKKKIEYAFGLFRMGESAEFSGEAISAAIKNIKLPENTAETEAIVNEIVGIVDGTDHLRHEQDQSIQGWLEALVEMMKDRLKEARAEAKRMSSTVQGITQISAGEPKQYRNPESELALERAKLGAVQGRLGSVEKSFDNVTKLENRQRELEKAIATLQPASDTAALEKHIADARKKVEDMEHEQTVTRRMTPLEIELGKVEGEMSALEKLLDAYRSKTGDLGVAHVQWANSLRHREENLAERAASFEQRKKAFEASLVVDTCTHCGSHHAHWSKDHSKEWLKEQFQADARDYANRAAEITQGIEATKKAVAKALAELNASKNLDEGHAENAAKKVEIKRHWIKLKEQRKLEYDAENKRMEHARSELSSATYAREKAGVAGEVRTRLQAELDATMRSLAECSRPAMELEQAGLFTQRSTALTNIARLEVEQRDFLTSQADEKRSAEAQLARRKCAADISVTAEAVKVLECIQSKMVTEAFGRILKTVNRVTGCLIKEPIEYRDGELGRFAGGTAWATHKTFSGTEQALIYAGISLALAESAPIKIVLIDEVAIDTESMKIVMARMVELARDGVLDQCVACISTNDKIEMDGVNIIAL